MCRNSHKNFPYSRYTSHKCKASECDGRRSRSSGRRLLSRMLESGSEASKIRVDSREDCGGVEGALLPVSLKY